MYSFDIEYSNNVLYILYQIIQLVNYAQYLFGNDKHDENFCNTIKQYVSCTHPIIRWVINSAMIY